MLSPRRSSAAVRGALALLLPALLLGCVDEADEKDEAPAGDGSSGDDGGDGGDGAVDTGGEDTGGEDTGGEDTGEPPVIDACAELGLPVRTFDAVGPFGGLRRETMADFSLPLRGGETWTLSERWSGCEVYVFLPHYFVVSELDTQTWWSTGVDDLLRRSPRNVHYFFVVGTADGDDAEAFGSQMDGWIAEALDTLRDEDRAWWSERLHVVDGASAALSGPAAEIINSEVGSLGFAIDRRQKVRGLGYMSAVEAYDSRLEWPWEWRLYSAANEGEFLNFEEERALRIEAEAASDAARTVVPVFTAELHEEYEDKLITLPDATTMAGFDTLEIEVLMECPNRELAEIGNCGAWDYIANMWLYDAETDSYLEMARFITTYHRESHWVVDASHALAWLQAGGERSIRYSWAPSWNTQPTIITVNLVLRNQGRGHRPTQAIPLFNGGAFNAGYNLREPVVVDVPEGAAKVELRAILTGHGMDASTNCAEFCRHSHHFTVGEATFERRFNEAGTNRGCQDMIGEGVVPNQAGTWWFGRGGWCPGQEVHPWVEDLTAVAPAGAPVTIRYAGRLADADPPDTSGNIELRSWLVVWE
ncbi:MAG: hypothetical protein JNM72_02905 [Deltaproteobacteria bacterium]|nr:hypothetical protein [Deltaproteobacteria bacterium]